MKRAITLLLGKETQMCSSIGLANIQVVILKLDSTTRVSPNGDFAENIAWKGWSVC